MKLFTPLYDWTLRLAGHRRAPWYLGGLSFAESSFFPIPPDVMLAPMTLARPDRAWFFATLTTLTSVLGGVLGYAIGWFAFDAAEPWLHEYHLWEKYQAAQTWFETYGVWAVFVAGFSPIPYKVFTIAAGAMHMAFLPFVIASVIGRGGRFFLVAGLIRLGGERFAQGLRKWVDVLGWLLVAAIVAAWFLLRG